nr:MAG TPA: hypothetical protein [Caudoviricetes sp.]
MLLKTILLRSWRNILTKISAKFKYDLIVTHPRKLYFAI